MDDQETRGAGRRPDDDPVDNDQSRESDQDYYWGGKPGEDFGPIDPPPPRAAPGGRAPEPTAPSQPSPSGRPPDEPRDDEIDPVWAARFPRRPSGRGPRIGGEPLRPDGVFTQPVRRRRWGPVLAALAALLVLGGLTAAVLLVISRPDLQRHLPWMTGDVAPSPSPVPAAAPAGAPAPKPSAAASPLPQPIPTPATVGKPAVASPTPLTIGAPKPSPPPTRPPPASLTPRPGPAILPTPPSLLTPPARLTTPQLFRTPPTVPSPRLPNISTRVWSEQVIHRVGDDASICAQTGAGSSAQLLVIAPDRSPQTLGEFTTPTERVCFNLRVDQSELYVLTLIVRDENANEVERQSAALWVSQ